MLRRAPSMTQKETWVCWPLDEFVRQPEYNSVFSLSVSAALNIGVCQGISERLNTQGHS